MIHRSICILKLGYFRVSRVKQRHLANQIFIVQICIVQFMTIQVFHIRICTFQIFTYFEVRKSRFLLFEICPVQDCTVQILSFQIYIATQWWQNMFFFNFFCYEFLNSSVVKLKLFNGKYFDTLLHTCTLFEN